MYERIQVVQGSRLRPDKYEVLDQSMRDVLFTFDTMKQAQDYLNTEPQQCPTCED